MNMPVQARGQPQKSFLRYYPPCCLGQGPLLAWNNSLDRLASESQGSSCLHFASTGTRHASPPLPVFLRQVMGIKLRSSRLCCKVFIDQAISPAHFRVSTFNLHPNVVPARYLTLRPDLDTQKPPNRQSGVNEKVNELAGISSAVYGMQ